MILSSNMLRAKLWSLFSGGRIHAYGARVNRGAILRPGKGTISVGRDTSISPGAMLLGPGDITIGDSCSINPYCILYGHGGLKIGDWVRIAAHTVIVPSNHNFSDVNRPIRLQGLTKLGVTIEDDVWIGANVTVLDGAHISTGCVIAAGAVVRGKTEPNGVYGGVPAKLIKVRGGGPNDRCDDVQIKPWVLDDMGNSTSPTDKAPQTRRSSPTASTMTSFLLASRSIGQPLQT